MAYFIKTGYWEKAKIGLKGWLDLSRVILDSVSEQFVAISNPSTTLSNTTTIDLSSTKATLISSDSTKTFTISYLGDDITLVVTLNTTAATYTFPATALCVSEGVATGDNILPLAGVSGDKYVIGIKKIGSIYYIISKNFGQ